MKAYAQPLVCWFAALIGLVLALLSEGIGDVLALGLLPSPLVLIARQLARARS